jgi:hypothetical protein
VLGQRDLHRRIAELHGLAAFGDNDLLARYSQPLGNFGCEGCTDNRRPGLSCYRTDIRDVIEMGVRNEYRVRLRDVRCLESDIVGPRRPIEVGIEQVDFPLIGELEIGIAQMQAEPVGAAVYRRADRPISKKTIAPARAKTPWVV